MLRISKKGFRFLLQIKHHQVRLNSSTGLLEKTIINKLHDQFKPSFLDVYNESYMHNVPHGSETHFKVVIVSEEFQDKRLVQCHRMVNETLKDELCGSIHALSIQAFTPEQWDDGETITDSPKCLGGKARERKKEKNFEES